MKIIRYQFMDGSNIIDCEIRCSENNLKINEEVAQRESYNGKYTIDNDEQEDALLSQNERIAELEEALELILSGVTE